MTPTPAASPPGRGWSMALRLAAVYTVTAFAALSATVVYLNFALQRALDREDDQFLADKLDAVRRRVRAGRDALPDDDRRGEPWLLVRVAPAGGSVRETDGMSAVLPASAFPAIAPGAAASTPAEYRSPAGRDYRVVSAWADDGVTLLHVALDQSQDEEVVGEFRRQSAYAVSACLLVVGGGGYALARRGLRPIADVTAMARRVRPDAMGERLVVAGLPREVRELAGTFNGMIDRLEDALARLGRFSGDIAHELRTPLNNLSVGTEIALSRPRTPDEYRAALAANLEECWRLTRLIDSLLFLARAENPKTQLARAAHDLADLLRVVEDFFAPAAADAGVRLTVECEPGLTVFADATLLRQVFGNLTSNALAHTPAGGAVTLFARRRGPGIACGVADTGAGIAAGDLPYVFDRFYRADAARSPGAGRVGLGLAIVRSIVELHAGTVAAESEPGHGTTVTVHFPATG